MIMTIAATAAFFSPTTAQIYLPALNTLAETFNVFISQINLTVTTYMVLQGLSPMSFAAFSDTVGRRPAYLLCFTIFVATNVGLAMANSYLTLLVLRMIQSAGASVTIALIQAVMADVATSAERGKYMGYPIILTIVLPAAGPVIGGALTQNLGWTSIFWFLTICGGIVLMIIFIFFPETCRNIVGNGSIAPHHVYRT